MACDEGIVEDVQHFVMHCPSYAEKRATLMHDVAGVLATSNGTVGAEAFLAMPSQDQRHILLGRRVGDPAAENRIDRATKRFLRKAWNARERAGLSTRIVNAVCGTAFSVSPPDM